MQKCNLKSQDTDSNDCSLSPSFIRFYEAVFSPDLMDKIHTNAIQAQSVNNNEKVNSFYREASECKTSSGMMAIFSFFFFFADHKAITVFQN